ncbi:hypothetical protein [Pseudoalteromonas tunicata]|jgi:chromosome segregation ATPase|uniref:Uncharacterized protein n=1 Tax=Pseudoalteromonas tunicata D2 TaxID=87626 RepID=A4C4Z1_9GAMM|nr:hypothetical protein [Pseudoalteromonas tunicata]ATC96904.1 hypothetical protein PTUN_b0531 [Pseudoalteromonas tunicata]AXT33037.1 hypothetical protein D1819_19605 [Pseudoalteromonas tunicata]EAR30623.1 hypothetical protein PTD2_03601 [Pseudoalteromonas tunicata D2]
MELQTQEHSLEADLLESNQQMQFNIEQAFERLLDDKNNQINALNNQIAQLNKRNKMQLAHIEIVEKQWQLSNQQLESVLASQSEQLSANQVPKHNEQEFNELSAQVEELQMSQKVLNHHCRDLNERNQQLNHALKLSDEKLQKINTLFNKQTAEFLHMQNDFNVNKQENTLLKSELRRYQEELKLLMGTYYDGVINKKKKISTNLPS